jgi:hypothetical protein
MIVLLLLLLCVCFLHYYGRKKTVWGCFSLGGGGCSSLLIFFRTSIINWVLGYLEKRILLFVVAVGDEYV